MLHDQAWQAQMDLNAIKQLHSQANSRAAQFKLGEGTSYIDEAIDIGRKALELCPPGHSERSISLIQLASHLSNRYDHFGGLRDLEESIVLAREGNNLHPTGHPNRFKSLSILVVCLLNWYERFGGMEDLDDAIVLGLEGLNLCPQGTPHRSTYLNNLALCLSTRYDQLGEIKDLNEAIIFTRRVLDILPPGSLDRPTSLSNLAAHLSTRYEKRGLVEDLSDAIILNREALHLYRQGSPLRFIPLNNLAADLSTRYEQLGAIEDLSEAIAFDREALSLRAQGHLLRFGSLNNLANHLSIRYNKLREIEDLNAAIGLHREALELSPRGHPGRSMSLNNLAAALFSRFECLGEMVDLDEAIALDREAIDLRPPEHPDRPMSLNNLAVHLSTRHKQLGAMEDLDAAIVLVRNALQLCPPGHSDRSRSLENLGQCLCSRFMHSHQLRDREEAFDLYTQLVHVPDQVVSSIDISATRSWINSAENLLHPTLLLAYETHLRLLIQHLVSLPSLPRHFVLLKDLTSSSLAVDAFSVCLREQTPARAVELLEQGRCIFWNQLTRLHSPLNDLMESGPAGNMLADKFMLLSSIIHDTINSPGADQHEQLFHLNLKLQKVITGIRELPGLSRFLLPPLFSYLRGAASEGPIIIVNASKYTCDALIIFLDQDPFHIPFQITLDSTREMSMQLRRLTVRAMRTDVTKELAAFLRKLWDLIVSPIVDFLRTIRPPHSRIWWCPTGEFSVFPLHAAGPYRMGQQNLPDLYISSYTPTLTALSCARRCASANFRRHFVAIGQAKAGGESELPSMSVELDSIGCLVSDLATFTRIDKKESCISRVIEVLGKNDWVHLACHGLPNRTQPFESAFALYDGHFTIQQIIGCNPKDREFAYLSACHTTVGDEESLDEVIHLASAMHFIGFRSVIGTMWAVDDNETNKITSVFYKHVVDETGCLDNTRAAFALNKTMNSVDVPLDQRILYIHLGV